MFAAISEICSPACGGRWAMILRIIKSWCVDRLAESMYQGRKGLSIQLANAVWFKYGEALRAV